MPDAPQTALPRWRGFNLLGLFARGSDSEFPEDDFCWIAELGFDFVRLPMSYLWWVDDDDPFRINESKLEAVDRAVTFGERHGLHVSVNFHRAPGYSVNREREEPFSLWKDAEAQDAFCLHWRTFAKRYAAIPPERLSFDLVNEPPAPSDGMSREDHARVITAATNAIREVSPNRLVVADGLRWGRDVVPELVDLGIAQSCRGYEPAAISHYEASWASLGDSGEPVWPGVRSRGQIWNRADLDAFYRPWAELAASGVGVHCGECGCFNKTPHGVFLAWFTDVLDILTGHGIGFALWNFRGSFGVLDSKRRDVEYESWNGHELDRPLLELLRSH
jgi:endoglucanase